MDLSNFTIPLTEQQQEWLLEYVQSLIPQISGDQRKIARLERDKKILNELYESEVRFRDFNEKEKELQYLYNHLLLEACPDMIFVLDPDLCYIIGTDVIAGHFGFDARQDLTGTHLTDILEKRMEQQWSRELAENCSFVLREQTGMTYSDRIPWRDGREAHANITINPAVGQDRCVMGVVLVMHDITRITQMKEEAERLSSAKSSFLARMSHEIRTPLNAVKGMSSLLAMTTLTNSQTEYVQGILSASETLLNVINDVLDYSNLDSDRVQILEQPYYVASLLSDISSTVYLKASQKKLAFVTDISPSIPAVLSGDEVRIRQILSHLLDNAVKFTQNGYVRLKVTSEQGRDSVTLQFDIEDTGIGISQDHMEQLFEAFTGSDFGPDQDYEGAGLGLAISRSLAGLMHGTIAVESSPGHGSRFMLTLPQRLGGIPEELVQTEALSERHVLLFADGISGESCATMLSKLFIRHDWCSKQEQFEYLIRNNTYTNVVYQYETGHTCVEENRNYLENVALTAIKNIQQAGRQGTAVEIDVLYEPVLIMGFAQSIGRNCRRAGESAPGDAGGAFQIQNTDVLVVDDNEVNLLVAAEMLSHYGLQVETALSGTEALVKMENRQYDLVFMDHMMPQMDGVETTRLIRAKGGRNADIPVIAFTANAVAGMREQFLESGMDDYISKPIEAGQLDRVLREWVSAENILENDANDSPDQARTGSSDLLNLLANVCELDSYGALRNIGGAEQTYLAVLETFSRSLPGRMIDLGMHLGSGDLEAFRIEIHGLKSALLSIGAQELGEQARKLELAAQDNRRSYVLRYGDVFLKELGSLLQKITGVIDPVMETRPSDLPVGDASMLTGSLERVMDLLLELEHEQAGRVLSKLQEYRYGSKTDRMLGEIRNSVENFNYDEASRLIGEILLLEPEEVDRQ